MKLYKYQSNNSKERIKKMSFISTKLEIIKLSLAK
jgi:hypothetical protein